MIAARAPALGLASALVGLTQLASAGAPPAISGFGAECRVRADVPLTCPPVAQLSALDGERVALQVVIDAGSEAVSGRLRFQSPPVLKVEVMRQVFVPVRARSRGKGGSDDALPWSASARPPDEDVLGQVADPLAPSEALFDLDLAAGERAAWWLSAVGSVGSSPRPGQAQILVSLEGARHARTTFELELIGVRLPRPPVSFFAYVERDELDDAARLDAYRLLLGRGVDPVGRWETLADLERDRPLLDGALSPDGRPPRVVVLGAYGTLGAPSPRSLAAVSAMTAAIPEEIEDVLLYAVDEDCSSDRGPAWRRALREAGRPASRAKVVVTCGDPPEGQGVDVVMTTAERFDPAAAAAAREHGVALWAYNGRLPHAGTMALDAPVESLIHDGWLAARYDLGRWFFWNTVHWSDGNRGGLGPRDLFADPETFHNADGDAVLYDGVLLFPGRQREGWIDPGGNASVLSSARLERLSRGLHDAALLALAARADPGLARDVLLAVAPRGLAEVASTEAAVLAGPEVLVAQRARLHTAIARGLAAGSIRDAPTDADAAAGLAELRRILPRAVDKGASLPGGGSKNVTHLALAGAAAAVLTAGLVAVARRRRRRVG